LAESRHTKPQSDWDTPFPIIEFKFTSYEDAAITYVNEPARNLFGEANVRVNDGIAAMRAMFKARMGEVQFNMLRKDGREMVSHLWQWSKSSTAEKSTPIPGARIPVVFPDLFQKDGKPFGYLPVVTRWNEENGIIRVRYLYLKVSDAMQKVEPGGYYVCAL
jgi:hypothetical protein